MTVFVLFYCSHIPETTSAWKFLFRGRNTSYSTNRLNVLR